MTITADEIAVAVGVAPDEVVVRGSKSIDPPRPAGHSWRVVCRDPGRCIDEQIQRVVSRLYDSRHRIGDLVADRDAESRLEVVRCFDTTKTEVRAELLGWSLEQDTFRFLVATGAYLEAEERDTRALLIACG